MTMKKLFYIFSLCLLAFAIGCSDGENDTTVPELGIESSGVIFSVLGGTGTIELKAPGATATADQDWFTVSVSGKTITVTASPNNTVNGRTGLVLIKQNGLERVVPVTQSGNRAPAPEVTEIMMPIKASEAFVFVDCEIPFTVTSQADWLTARVMGDTLVLKTADNSGHPIRTTTVILTSGTFNVPVTVTQDGIVLIPENTDVVLSNDGETLKVSVEASGTFTAKSSASWLSVSKGSNYVNITAEKNPGTAARTAVVTLSLDGYNVEIKVTQRLYIYTDYLGTWRLNAKSRKDGSAVTLEVKIVEKVAGTSYLVYGWGGSDLVTNFPFTMNFTAADGTIRVENQENIGTDEEGNQVAFTGATKDYSISLGKYTCMISQRKGNIVTWITQNDIIGVGYHFKKPNSWYSYNADPVTTDMTMTRISSVTSGINTMSSGKNTRSVFVEKAIAEK